MSPPDRPDSDSADDVARWEAEVRAHEERMAKEDEFRDSMLQFAARTDVTLTGIKDAQRKHDEDDARRFRLERRARKRLERRVDALGGQVTQTRDISKANWTVVTAWVSAFVAIAGVGWALVEKFGGVLNP